MTGILSITAENGVAHLWKSRYSFSDRLGQVLERIVYRRAVTLRRGSTCSLQFIDAHLDDLQVMFDLCNCDA